MGYINPYIYIAIVFLLPLQLNRFLFLSIVFIYGLILDAFLDSGGIHTFSLVSIAYLRDSFIRVLFKKSKQELRFFILDSEAFGAIFNYTAILTLIHHSIVFSLANFSFENLGLVITKTLYSSISTLIIYFLGKYILTKK